MAESEGWYRWQEATSRFDYLLVSAAGATCLFHAQTFHPTHRDPWLWSLALLPFALLLASTFFGLKRIEATNLLIAIGHRRVEKVRERQKLDEASLRNVSVSTWAGEAVDAAKEGKQLQEDIDKLLATENRWGKSAARAYSWRNWLLYLGLLALVVHRVVEAWLALPPPC